MPVPEEYPSGPWGISSSTRLYNWLIDSGNAVEVYSLAQLEKGDVISYDLNENGRPDHTVLYLGNGKIAAHTACYWNVNWDIYNPSSGYYKFVHIKSDTAQPDLVVEDIWVEPSEFGPGATVKLWQRTKNIGGGDAVGTFRIQRYFDDVPISHADKNGLAVDASYASWCSYTWPSDCNSHTVKVVADLYDAIAESEEGNNERSESFSAICEEVDLTVTSVNAPTSAQVGGYIAVSWTVRNQGTAASGSFYNRISLATTPYGTAIPLGNYPMNSIAAVSSSSDAEIPQIPETVSPGYYYITVFADAFYDVTESDENNNINRAPDQIHITPNCGNMDVAPTSWSPTIEHGHSDSQIVTVSASSGPVKGVTVSKISGPTWLGVSPTNLGDIASGSSKTFTMTASPPAGTSGDFAYTVRVSNTCGSPSSRDVTGTIHVEIPCGNMGVSPTSWSPTIEHGHSDSRIVTVSASSGPVKGVTVSKISGPTWLSVSPTNLGDIASGSSKTFTMTASPPSGTSGDFAYTVRVSNTCGSPSSRDVTGTIHVEIPCGNMGVSPTSWSPTIEHGHSDSQIVTVSASGGIVKGVTVSKISGPTWLSVSQTNLGDIALVRASHSQ